MLFASYFAPKKKKNHTAAIVAGVLAVAAFTPIAFYSNKRKKKWGIGSLTVSVTKETTENGDNKVVVNFPGVGFVVSCWRKAAKLASRVYTINRATRRVAEAEAAAAAADELFCEDEADVEVTEDDTENSEN